MTDLERKLSRLDEVLLMLEGQIHEEKDSQWIELSEDDIRICMGFLLEPSEEEYKKRHSGDYRRLEKLFLSPQEIVARRLEKR